MGSRKKQMAETIKANRMNIAFAKLNNCPTSPRKMRLVADLVRGEKVEKALNILKFSQKEASRRLEKLVLSAVANWQAKNEDSDVEAASLFIKEIRVDSGGAAMGGSETSSVVDSSNRLWRAPNVLVVDGACWPTSAWQSPTLTMMALSRRACLLAFSGRGG